MGQGFKRKVERNRILEENKIKESVLSFEYNVTNEEEGQAFLLFQKKFVYKKNWIKTVLFGIVAILFGISIYRSPDQPLNYMLCTICLAAIFVIWYNTKKIRVSLMNALKILEDDKYIFTLYNDEFKIETLQEEQEFDEDGELIPPIPPREVSFSDLTLKVFDTVDKFVLVLKKDTIYVLPKRCMTRDQINRTAEIFSTKLNEDYLKISDK